MIPLIRSPFYNEGTAAALRRHFRLFASAPKRERNVCRNPSVQHRTVEASFNAGLSLKGSEVKAIRDGSVDIRSAFVDSEEGPHGAELFLKSSHIGQHRNGFAGVHASNRERKLLLHRSEIDEIVRHLQNGKTVLPNQMYFAAHGRHFCKVTLSVCAAVQYRDKRDKEEEREWKNMRTV